MTDTENTEIVDENEAQLLNAMSVDDLPVYKAYAGDSLDETTPKAKLFDVVEAIKTVEVVKRVGPKIFLYVDTSLSYEKIIQSFRQRIISCGGIMYVYQFYRIFNGMIDYNEYLSDETKMSMPYYQSRHKDILESEYLKK